MRAPCFIALLAALAAPAAAPAIAISAEERGDRAWSRRADAFADGVVPPAAAQEAVAAYEEMLGAEPGNLRVRFKLIEALFFRGSFAARDKGESRALFERMAELADETLSLAPPSDTAAAHFWAGIAWGVWGMSHSRFASMRHGVATRIRDHAQALIEIDPAYADGGGWRLLGRLHSELPRIPLVTGWVDRREGLALLERALESSTREHRNLLFLAEAIVKHAPSRMDEAVALLEQLGRRRPDPAKLVEETQILEQAAALLRELQPPGPEKIARGGP